MARLFIAKLMVILFSFSAFATDNCEVLAQIFDRCAYEKGGCKDKVAGLKVALSKAGIKEDAQEKIISSCYFYCVSPNMWIRADFIRRCQGGNIKKTK